MVARATCPQRALVALDGAILDRVCRGDSDKEIARALGRPLQTIKNHLVWIYVILGARNRAHAAVLWLSARPAYIHAWDHPPSPPAEPLTFPVAPLPPHVLSPVEAFWERVAKKDYGCWVWQTHSALLGGSPRCHMRALRPLGDSARRIAWALTTGMALAPALYLYRNPALCKHPACINPDHMIPGRQGHRPGATSGLRAGEYQASPRGN